LFLRVFWLVEHFAHAALMLREIHTSAFFFFFLLLVLIYFVKNFKMNLASTSLSSTIFIVRIRILILLHMIVLSPLSNHFLCLSRQFFRWARFSKKWFRTKNRCITWTVVNGWCTQLCWSFLGIANTLVVTARFCMNRVFLFNFGKSDTMVSFNRLFMIFFDSV